MKKRLLCFIIFLITYSANSQNLFISNVDASGFPNVKANFFAFDASWNQQSPDKGELSIKENGLTRTVLNVTCSTPIKPLVLSSVLVMDISNSMNGIHLDIAKAAAQAWVNAIPANNSQCALTTFNHFNYFNQDFTPDKNKLLTAVNNLSYGDGTDFNKALIDSICGGLRATKTGKYQKVIVLMIDGLSSSKTDVSKIVAEAKLQKCKIFVVSVDMKCPKELQDISTQTGGQWYENITTESKATEIYHLILKLAQGAELCSITWKSEANCDTADVNVELTWNGLKVANMYPTPATAIQKLEVTPLSILFGQVVPGKSIDTTINIKAIGSDFKITAINLKYGSNAYRIKNVSFPLTIPKNATFKIPIRFTPTDSNLSYGGFEILTENCSASFSAIGGFPDKPMIQQTLRLTHPNGGEVFVTGLDTLITWEGVMPSDLVTLKYSIDNGVSWKVITDKATGLKYIWKNIPKSLSNRCIIRISHGYVSDEIITEWQKSYGGSDSDVANSIQQTNDGGYIVAGVSLSKDGDLTENKGKFDWWLVKVDSLGMIMWQKSLGGSEDDEAFSVQQTMDGGYIVAGSTQSPDGDVIGYTGGSNIWIVKFKTNGDVEWQKTYSEGYSAEARAIKQTRDGGYIVAVNMSSTDSFVWLLKLNSIGEIEWQKTSSKGTINYTADVQITDDNGYIVVGESLAYNHKPDYWVCKLDSMGLIEWQYTWGGSKNDYPYSIKQTKDGGYIVAGETWSNDGDVTGSHNQPSTPFSDCWILKLKTNGKLEWEKAIGGSNFEHYGSICRTNDEGYVIAIITYSNDGDVKNPNNRIGTWLVKLNSVGKIISQRILQMGDVSLGYSFQTTVDGGLIIAGFDYHDSNEDFWVAKLNFQKVILQSDQSDAVFSIVEPLIKVNDINMKTCLVRSIKDSIVTDFIKNVGNLPFTVDSIYFRGTDTNAFSLVSELPKYTVFPNLWHPEEIRFSPKHAGLYNAEMVIITQADTLVRNIRGEGIEQQLKIESEIVDFGKVNVGDQRDSIQVLTIKNISPKPIAITNTQINGPNLTDFKTIATIDNFTLKPNETKKIDLRFKPSDIGRTSGILAFYYDGVGSPAEVQLYGEGVVGNSQDLVSPANDTINVPIDCKLIWKNNSAYESYNLQVSKDEIFSDIAIDTTTKLTNYKFTRLDFLQTYFWRVKAIIGSEESNWSPVWKFTTLMDSIKLIAPVNQSSNLHQVIKFEWEEGIYQKYYRLQISEDKDFKTIADNIFTHQSHMNVVDLKYFTKYFWRMRNESGDTLGYWSNIWQFKTGMSKLSLIYPENTQTGLGEEVNFKWSDVIGSEYYQLQISKNYNFTNLVFSRDSIITTEHFVPNLESQMLYYWRVRIWNEESIDSAYWSEIWTFRTGESSVNDDSEFIDIIPNPAGDFITITLKPSEGFEPSEGSEIQIYNTLGEKVLTASARHAVLLRFNISNLPKGIYFVKVGLKIAKFVKM
ncbi:MAG: choice-of-anchor D domain-containing protein [bacterium]